MLSCFLLDLLALPGMSRPYAVVLAALSSINDFPRSDDAGEGQSDVSGRAAAHTGPFPPSDPADPSRRPPPRLGDGASLSHKRTSHAETLPRPHSGFPPR